MKERIFQEGKSRPHAPTVRRLENKKQAAENKAEGLRSKIKELKDLNIASTAAIKNLEEEQAEIKKHMTPRHEPDMSTRVVVFTKRKKPRPVKSPNTNTRNTPVAKKDEVFVRTETKSRVSGRIVRPPDFFGR